MTALPLSAYGPTDFSFNNFLPTISSPDPIPTTTLPTIPGMGSPTDQMGLGFNIPTAQLALQGIGTIGSLYNAFQMQKLAKKQFNFTKDVTETNLANQIQSYNTALSDKIGSRAKMQGMSAAQAQSYMDQNKLSRHPGNG